MADTTPEITPVQLPPIVAFRLRAHGLAPKLRKGQCAWFLGCRDRATGTTPHPILGDVATCDAHHRFAGGDPR